MTKNDLREHLADKEVTYVVEGIEPMVSGTFQTLQFYTNNVTIYWSEDTQINISDNEKYPWDSKR